ncbi:Lar family restriction alleviation protein [Sinorhizobium chiapasense]|uniref:Lar family restriction alleviation protein n=1 Tax=Sinorhizobium chiapasense TaxID=501572 RepID=A0ABZ2BAX1_9HYPH
MTDELLPCPFCGGKVTLEQPMRARSNEWWGVVCRNTENLGGTCAIEQRPSRTKEAAAERWNRRSGTGERLVVEKIAQIASAVGFQANEPAMELAGQIVSVLAANPEHIDRFMREGTGLFLDGTLNPENGSLTYRAINGSILSPAVLRQQKGTQQ